MLAGFALFEELGEAYECLEVFPQATVRTMGIGQRHKSKKEGLRQQFEAIGTRTGWTSGEKLRTTLNHAGYGAIHARLDAFMCAWVASLWPERLTPHGQPPGDVIWVPELRA